MGKEKLKTKKLKGLSQGLRIAGFINDFQCAFMDFRFLTIDTWAMMKRLSQWLCRDALSSRDGARS